MKRVFSFPLLPVLILSLVLPQKALAETTSFEVEKDTFANQAYPTPFPTEEEEPTPTPEETLTPTPTPEEEKTGLILGTLTKGQEVIGGLIILAVLAAGIGFAVSRRKPAKEEEKPVEKPAEKEEKKPPTSS